MLDLKGFETESRNDATTHLDSMSALEIVDVMNQEDAKVIEAVKSQRHIIAKIIESATRSLYGGGRIIYVGAGTSGRLGVLDAVECPPTFGVDYNTVLGLIAGGDSAFVKAKEGSEDQEDQGRSDLEAVQLTSKDIVIGLAASGRTPYVIGALNYASSLGCDTASIACNKDSEISKHASLSVEVIVGPEVLTGSTRLKAGTAQKMVLNMISTGAMVGFGKVYQNLMVDVKQSNEKLKVRAQNIVIEATGISREGAIAMLEKSGGSVKVAIVMILHNVSERGARMLLESSKGHIKNIVKGG